MKNTSIGHGPNVGHGIEYKSVGSDGTTNQARSIPQSELTAECWLVQMSGLDRCKLCEFVDTEECGGADIRKTGKNEKGYKVPLGEPL